MSVIITDGLCKHYKETPAVRDVTFRIEAGEIFGFLGPNGAGKSTTVRMLTTLLAPTSGTASVCGFDVQTEHQRVREHIGYVSQELIADNYLTARENMRVVGGLYHLPKKDMERRIDELLELVDLRDRAEDRVKTYSGGMRKRLDIVCGLLHTPSVIFLDEPTLGLDVESRLRIWEYIRRLRDAGTTVFLCTNYLDEADQLCDRLAIIDGGTIQALDTPDAMKDAIGGEVVTLTAADSAGFTNGFVNLLNQQEFVQRVQETDGRAEVFVDVGSAALPHIMELAGRENIRFDKISMGRLTLDEVFLHVIGHRMTAVGDDETSSQKSGK
jgi:ABC-2 type transport system ATP-binding protein